MGINDTAQGNIWGLTRNDQLEHVRFPNHRQRLRRVGSIKMMCAEIFLIGHSVASLLWVVCGCWWGACI